MLLRLAPAAVVAVAVCDAAFSTPCVAITDDAGRLACFDAARSCARIPSERERLACFDGAYATAGPADESAVESAIESADGPATADAPAADATAGFSDLTASPEEFAERRSPVSPTEVLEATIVDVSRNALRIDYLRLDNGSVWRETEDSRVRFEAGQKVRLTKGILGSTNLTVDGSDRAVKVKRIN